MKRAEGERIEIKVYDTLTRQLQPIKPRNGKVVHIYCCGPTVYRDAHVGNLRTFLLSDLVRRALTMSGFESLLIQNITDVGHMSEDFEEDKILAQSRREKRDPFAIARDYEARFHDDLALLNISPADSYPRASECIPMMLGHIEKLFELGYAYRGDDTSVYFDSQKFNSYGELSGNRLDALKPGHRYEFTEGGAKRFHADWALWKAAGNRSEMIWDTPWGRGFPGWHIECSAMSLHYLNGHVDLHIGGIDLRFPHHENERAQSNPVTGDEAVDLWLHGEHLLFEGRKMSKSAGNVVLLSDVVAKGIDPLSVRFCFLENRYRSQMDLSWQSINAAFTTLQRWREKYQVWKGSEALKTTQADSIISDIYRDFCDDLDTPRAMIKLRNVEKDSSIGDGEKAAIFQGIDSLFGLNLLSMSSVNKLSSQAEELLAQRELARSRRDFAESDVLRDQLLELGIEVRDNPDGQSWSWKARLN